MASSIPILTFHAIENDASVISFSPQLFRRVVADLHEHGFRTWQLAQVADHLSSDRPVPDNTFVATFDDGYESVFREALPVLREYGMCATVFLTVGATESVGADSRLPSLEGRSMLSWREIREMSEAGFTFGAHTLTHPDLTRLSPERMKIEICRSKAMIENKLGSAVLSFAYPYGRYDPRSREIVAQHFACACSDKLGLSGNKSDRYALERVDTYYLRTERLFSLMRTSWFGGYVTMRSLPRRLRRALATS